MSHKNESLWIHIKTSRFFFFNYYFLRRSCKSRNHWTSAAAYRNVIDVAPERWQDDGGAGADVVFVPRTVGRQGRRDQDADPRPGPGPLPSLLGAEGAGAGGEPVLQQVPGEDPAAAQVRLQTSLSGHLERLVLLFSTFLIRTLCPGCNSPCWRRRTAC